MNYTRIAVTPVTHIGWGAVQHLLTEVQQFAPQKILIVADPILKQIGVVDNVIKPIADAGYLYDIYTDIIPEPLLATGQQLVDFARAGNYSLVIGIGGGSALDLAKLAAVFTANDGDVKDYLNLSGSKKLQQKGIPTILIPTTSGTGAEVTNISVLALEHTKDVISHDYLIADVAIVDAQLTVSVPPKITAATGADALTHAIEAYISVNANAYSDGLALQAIKLISGSLRAAVANGNDQQARTDMAYGSYLAGLAFFNAGVGAIHALAYPLGGQFHIAHGDSNAVLIPYVMSYIRSCCFAKMGDIYAAMGGDVSGIGPEEASVKCIFALVNLLRDIGIPPTLAGFNVPASALEQLTADGVKQKRLLARCPMALTETDISNIYKTAFSGELAI
ncbi:iron-containing alcohol dehydrogenase [Mucilaginibacter mali]|uniref:Iron-containing alcohol dehydrogenase n=1 Tax=Mucilaginibacter mali TaxID=2740462 RepID=A0A7D4UDM5_9SPHI|nr:iron-containing alcohol dehydrogenase [Mucilaginibacter mali]QKJ32638.1 iron-containing alcohol dehydrogenase [Mucilaginibacter mali]